MHQEIRDPFKNIPLAIIITLLVATGVYLLVGGIAIAAAGADMLASAASEQAAPLEVVARRLLHVQRNLTPSTVFRGHSLCRYFFA